LLQFKQRTFFVPHGIHLSFLKETFLTFANIICHMLL
jgi:hypothetical protein